MFIQFPLPWVAWLCFRKCVELRLPPSLVHGRPPFSRLFTICCAGVSLALLLV